MEKVIAKNKKEFGEKRRELIKAGFREFDCEKNCSFIKTENFKQLGVIIVKGWKKA